MDEYSFCLCRKTLFQNNKIYINLYCRNTSMHTLPWYEVFLDSNRPIINTTVTTGDSEKLNAQPMTTFKYLCTIQPAGSNRHQFV